MKRSAPRAFGIVSVLIAMLIAASALRPTHLTEINRATGALRSREIYFGTYKTPWRLKPTSFSLIAEELQLDTAHEWQSFTHRSSWLFIVERQCSSTPASFQLHYLRSELGELALAEQRTWVRRFAAASEPERKHLIEQLTKRNSSSTPRSAETCPVRPPIMAHSVWITLSQSLAPLSSLPSRGRTSRLGMFK